ncbi:TPA: hypothetical protein HL326_08420 [Escherichia coli]|nr:hypothetical protein [Escherichia coli]
MKKFENITVLYVDEFDYANQEFLPEVVKAIDVADIVIRGKRIVKNRLACTSRSNDRKTSQQDNYEGICLEPDSFAVNIYHLLHATQVLHMSSNYETKTLGSEILNFACEYAKAAAEKRISAIT